jgi:tetratricopeptide (TPR) repeat protein
MGHVKPDLAELCRTIDAAELGRRIRNARIEAHLTQAQVAGNEISTAYVSRIEDGQRRPDVRLLGAMAGRIGMTVEELLLGMPRAVLLELHRLLDRAGEALDEGDGETALRDADEVLAGIGDAHLVDLRLAARRIRASALESAGRLEDAIAELEDLASSPKPDLAWLRTLIALCRCLIENGDLDRAIALGEEGAAKVESAGLDNTTEAIQLTVITAGGHVLRGDLNHAMRTYRQAIDRATDVNSTLGRASAYWSASLIESRRGEATSALSMAQEALALFEVCDEPSNLGRLRTQVAALQLKLDPPDATGAIETLARAEVELEWSTAGSLDLADLLLVRARCHVVLGDHPAALVEIAQAEELLGDSSPLLSAGAAMLHGQIAAAREDVATARESFGRAIRMLDTVHADREAAQLWLELANLLEDLGEKDQALDAYRRAAASAGLRTGNVAVRPAVPEQRER